MWKGQDRRPAVALALAFVAVVVASGAPTWAASQIDGRLLRTGSVSASKLATGSVGTRALANGAVRSQDVATGAIGSAQIAAGAVGASQLADGAGLPPLLRSAAVGTAAVDLDGEVVIDVAVPVAGSYLVLGSGRATSDGVRTLDCQLLRARAAGGFDDIDDITVGTAAMKVALQGPATFAAGEHAVLACSASVTPIFLDQPAIELVRIGSVTVLS